MGTFLCIECGKSFEEEAFLYIHQNKTHDKTVRSCEKCGESFVGKVALQNHKRKHNNAVAKMKAMMKYEICPYETSNLANLKRHTKAVHSEKPQKMKKSTECGECGKTFGRKDHLDKHVKKHVKIVHEQVKRAKTSAGIGTFVRKNKVKAPNQFMCSECSKTFNSNANLKHT